MTPVKNAVNIHTRINKRVLAATDRFVYQSGKTETRSSVITKALAAYVAANSAKSARIKTKARKTK